MNNAITATQLSKYESHAIEAINHIPSLGKIGAHEQENLRNRQIECRNFAYKYGVDMYEENNWTWPY
jgi:xylulose-5-phosphate/fructose-6-phosphate phosphoketolase